MRPAPVVSGDAKGLVVRNIVDTDRLMDRVRASAARAQKQVAALSGDPLDMLRRMKFDQIGYHPIEDRRLNLVEQINQTWSMAVAIEAARKLLELHPEAGGFRLAPGTNASLELDIMSVEPGLVGAETFAAVHPANNRKLKLDLAKLSLRQERHRYVFFMSPLFPRTERHPQFEVAGVAIRAACAVFGASDKADGFIAAGMNFEQVRTALWDHRVTTETQNEISTQGTVLLAENPADASKAQLSDGPSALKRAYAARKGRTK